MDARRRDRTRPHRALVPPAGCRRPDAPSQYRPRWAREWHHRARAGFRRPGERWLRGAARRAVSAFAPTRPARARLRTLPPRARVGGVLPRRGPARRCRSAHLPAVAAFNDLIALAVLASCRRQHIEVPDDLALIGGLDVALDTVKRYAPVKEPTGDRRAPRHELTLVDPTATTCAPAPRIRATRAPHYCGNSPESVRRASELACLSGEFASLLHADCVPMLICWVSLSSSSTW
ncbi:substrate-binding domain-containing protein [Streptomyces sp. NBC_01236]|uniref:substrate-binding domain-containing protein n=1 Tax=Streptomyces sp. NBC_01236 TaxID=2903789 RepID=UPI003FA353B4|nr:substrate-binding domain-containing protein [Streptomyces sp. NBC_01236]